MFVFNLAFNFMLGLLAIPMAIAIIVLAVTAIVKAARMASLKADLKELELMKAKRAAMAEETEE